MLLNYKNKRSKLGTSTGGIIIQKRVGGLCKKRLKSFEGHWQCQLRTLDGHGLNTINEYLVNIGTLYDSTIF